MANRIQIRRDNAAGWTAANPVLASGELGYETDTKKRKIGDGTTAWTGVNYLPQSPRPTTIPAPQVLAYAFNQANSSYNVTPTSLARARGASGKSLAGLSRFDICYIGTSLTAGTGAGVKTKSAPSQLQNIMVGRGHPNGGSGLIPGQSNNSATTDPRVTLGTGWSAFDAFKTNLVKAVDATTATWADNQPSTRVEVWYQDYGTFTWSYTIDGGAAVNVTLTNTGTFKKLLTTGLASANHTVVISPGASASAGTPLYMMGVNFTNTTGVAVHNLGVGGLVAVDAFDQAGTNRPIGVALSIAPQLTIIEIGSNETGPLAATFTTKYQSGINALIAAGSDVLIVGSPPTGAATTTRDVPDVLIADYQLADTNNLAMVDLSDAMISWTNVVNQGMNFTGDAFTVHFTAAGYAFFARTIDRAIGL